MKRKLLLAALCVVGALGMRAQTDVTSTYLTNAGFEGDHSSYSNPSSDRDIYQPEDWTVSYTNGNLNDLTSLNSETTQWSQFSGKPQPTNGGSKAYWIRFRWGSSENITLSQETSANLPAGTYAVSVDAYSDDNTGTATISVADLSQTVRTNGAWANYKVVFTLTEAQKVTVSLSYTNSAADDHAAAFDNVKILDLTSEPTGITLKNDLGGTAADLSDFNVWYNDYTLEVEGTAGTPITIAADNISYTPEANATVRFVKKDGIVYVYEGTSYKTAVHSSKADIIYSSSLTDNDYETNNYLANAGFETVGDVLTDNKAWKLGEPWVTGGFSWGNSSSGIRVQKNNNKQVIIWRGTGNNPYFSQQVSSLRPYKGYKLYVRQVAGSNGFGGYRFGIGNQAGDISYLSASITLGAKSNANYNQIHEAVLGSSENIPLTGAYFTAKVPSSARNSADNGSTTDPLSQIDWIGLVGSDDFPISGVSSASYVYGTAYAPATAKSSYLAAKAAAEVAIATYTNVTGSEKTALQGAIDATVEDNDAAYNEATDALETATTAFISAKDSYDAYKTALDAVGSVTESNILATTIAGNTSATADDAQTAAAILTKYNDVKTATSASPVESSFVTNGTFDSNKDGWTATGGFQNNQTKASDSNVGFDKFWENWNGSAKVNKMSQTIENIPNGTYCLNISAFVNELAAETQYVFANSDKTNLTANKGVDYKVFTEVTNNTIEIGLEQTTATAKWMAIDNVSLTYYGTGNVISSVEASDEDYAALKNAIEAKPLGFEEGEYAPYNNVEVIETLAAAKAIDQTTSNKKSDVQTAISNLTDATWTANNDDIDAIFNGSFSSDVELAGWTRTNTWGQKQTGLSGNYATAYYNQPGSLQYGNQGVYTMPLKANTWYKLTFAYRSHESNSNNGMTVSILNGEEGLAATNFEENNSTTDWAIKEHIFQTVTAGNYVLTLANSGNTWITGVSITKSTQSSATMSVKASKWGTFVAPFDVTIPAGIRAYKVTGVEEGYMVKTEVKTTIPANTPVVLKNETEGNITETFSGDGLPESENCTFGLLTGLYYQKTDIPAGSYVLQTQDGVQAFYQVESTMSDKGVANRCYLTLPVNANKRNALFFDKEEGTTGLEAPAATSTDDGILYNVAGQQVNASYKGLIIKNRRVMLNK